MIVPNACTTTLVALQRPVPEFVTRRLVELNRLFVHFRGENMQMPLAKAVKEWVSDVCTYLMVERFRITSSDQGYSLKSNASHLSNQPLR